MISSETEASRLRFPIRMLSRIKPRSYLFSVCAFVFLAHLYASDFKGIWIDEGYRFFIANGTSFQKNLNERRPSDISSVIKVAKPYVHQPLYYAQVNLVMRLSRSYSPVIQYMTNTFMFLLSAVGIFCLAGLFLPLEGQLFCLLLYALNGQAMAFALQIREYCLILCLVVWNSYFFLRFVAASADDKKWLLTSLIVGHLLTAILGLYASFWTVIFFAPQALLMLWNAFRGQKGGLPIVASHVVAGLSLIPWMLNGVQKLNMKTWDVNQPTMFYLNYRLKKGFEFLFTGNVIHRWIPHAFETVFVVFVFALIAYLVWSLVRFHKLNAARRYVTLAFLFFLGFQVAYCFLKDPLSVSARYFILYLPFTSLAIGIIFTETSKVFGGHTTRRSVFEAVAFLVVIGSGLLQIVQYYHDPDVDHGDDFRKIYNYLDTRVAPNDDVVVDAAVNARCLQFYSNSPKQFISGFEQYTPIVTPKSKVVWLIINRTEPAVRSAFDSLRNRLAASGYRLVDQTEVERTLILHFAASL